MATVRREEGIAASILNESGSQDGYDGQEHETPAEAISTLFRRNGKPKAASTSKEQLIDSLVKRHFTDADYYKKLSKSLVSSARRNTAAVVDADLLEKLNSEELPKSYDAIDIHLARLEALTEEANDFQDPKKKPDIGKSNYLKDYKKIFSGYKTFYSARLRQAMRGSKRTLDDVLRETISTIGDLQKETDTAIGHSNRIIDGLISYQEEIVAPRIRSVAKEWERAYRDSMLAEKLINAINENEEGCNPEEYSTFSTSKRNVQRLQQHSSASMRETEAVAVQSGKTLETVNSLEGNLTTGMLELKNLSTLIAHTVEDVQYTTEGAKLLTHGYKSAFAIGKAAKTMRAVITYRVNEINNAIISFGNNLETAQKDVNESDKSEKDLPKEEKTRIAVGVNYAGIHKEAIALFSRMGVNCAKNADYRT